RQRRLKLVVVGNDQVQSEAARFLCLLDAADAAIHRDDERRAAEPYLLQSLGIKTVALVQAVRYVEVAGAAHQAQSLPKNRRPGKAVDVVISVNADPLALLNRPPHALGRVWHTRQQRRVVEPFERRRQETLRISRLANAAIDQELRHNRRQSQSLSECCD